MAFPYGREAAYPIRPGNRRCNSYAASAVAQPASPMQHIIRSGLAQARDGPSVMKVVARTYARRVRTQPARPTVREALTWGDGPYTATGSLLRTLGAALP